MLRSAIEEELRKLREETARLRVMVQKCVEHRDAMQRPEALDSVPCGGLRTHRSTAVVAPAECHPGVPERCLDYTVASVVPRSARSVAMPVPTDAAAVLPTMFSGAEGTARLYRLLADTYPWLAPERVASRPPPHVRVGHHGRRNGPRTPYSGSSSNEERRERRRRTKRRKTKGKERRRVSGDTPRSGVPTAIESSRQHAPQEVTNDDGGHVGDVRRASVRHGDEVPSSARQRPPLSGMSAERPLSKPRVVPRLSALRAGDDDSDF